MSAESPPIRLLRQVAGLEGGEEVEAHLQRLLEAGRAAWPDLALDAETFVRHVARHVPRGADPGPHLEALHAADLYLACACAQRLSGALAAFQERYTREVDAAARGRGGSTVQQDELRQVLWEKLFVGREGAPPKIADYSGRGPLAGWVRVAAVRTALNLQEQGGHEVLADDDTSSLLETPTAHPEVTFLKSHYRAEFKQALEDALAALPSEQRNVLRLYFLDGLSIDRIGAVFGVHRATAARWVARGREALLERTCKLLSERLKVSAAELDSLIGLVRSQLDMSLSGLLTQSKG